MKKIKIIALLISLSLLTGFGIYTKNPKLEQDVLANNRMNPVEIAKEHVFKSNTKDKNFSKGNIEFITNNLNSKSNEIRVEETAVGEVENTAKINDPKVQENKETVDYIWQKESFGVFVN